jgi:hypothetical protein
MFGRLISCIAASLVLGACSADDGNGGAPASALAAGEWMTLFDGSSLVGWAQVGDANWSLVDGAVRADAGNGFLLTTSAYRDFDLELEFWVTPDANSGVFVRCANPADIGAGTCYEVNIFDQRPDPTYRTGAIVDVAAPRVHIETGNRWNTYFVSARGNRLTVTLNGEQTVATQDDRLAVGPIALQYGAGAVMFRNVRIRTY